jgi:hypothetical protein
VISSRLSPDLGFPTAAAGTEIEISLPSTDPVVVPAGTYVTNLGAGAPSCGISTVPVCPYTKFEPPSHFTKYRACEYGKATSGRFTHHVTTQDGAPTTYRALCCASIRFASRILNVRTVPLSAADASRMSSAGTVRPGHRSVRIHGVTDRIRRPVARRESFRPVRVQPAVLDLGRGD